VDQTEQFSLRLDLGPTAKDARDAAKAIDEIKASSEDAAKAGAKVEDATKKATKGTSDFGRATLESGRILQDFVQGGFSGIINNLEGFTRAIGLGAGAAGAITALGVAALVAIPAIKSLWSTIVNGSNEVPKSTDRLESLNDELKKQSKTLEDLKGKQTLTNEELASYNRLLSSTAELERKVADAKKAKADAEALGKIHAFGVDDDSSQIVKDLQAGIGGKQDQLVAEVNDTLVKNSKALSDAQAALHDVLKQKDIDLQVFDPAAIDKKYAPIIAAQERKISAIRTDILNEATTTVADAMIRGNEASLKKVIDLVGKGSKFATDLTSSLPEVIREFDKARREEEESDARYLEAKKKHVAELKKQNESEEEGMAHHRAILAQQEQARKEFEASIPQEAAKANLKAMQAASQRPRYKSRAERDKAQRLRKRDARRNGNKKPPRPPSLDARFEALQSRREAFAVDAEMEARAGVKDGDATKALAATNTQIKGLGLEAGAEFRQYANKLGYKPLKSDVDEAAQSIMADMESGMSQAQANDNALQALIQKVVGLAQRQAAKSNADGQWIQQMSQQVDTLPTVMDFGW
jgi:hypothetical protein